MRESVLIIDELEQKTRFKNKGKNFTYDDRPRAPIE